MSEQDFGTKLFEASAKCIDIAGIAQMLSGANLDEQVSKLWLNPAMCGLATMVEQLSETLMELEEEYHSQGKFKYPCELDSTHTHTLMFILKQTFTV